MSAWYVDLAAYDDPADAAREWAGNWRSFESFGWGGKPEHRPEDCAIIYLEHRDSDCLDQSNAAEIYAALKPATGLLDDGDMVEIQSHSHWAVGHVDGIVVRCLTDDGQPTWAFVRLWELAKRLDSYPILNEDDFSEREQIAADETWKNCFSPAERIAYIRRHSEQFEFRSFADMLGCVRGKYFAGWASELLG